MLACKLLVALGGRSEWCLGHVVFEAGLADIVLDVPWHVLWVLVLAMA